MSGRDASSAPVVVVTGGSGYLGRTLVEQLLTRSDALAPREVRVFDRAPSRHGDRPGLRAIRGDVRSLRGVREAVRGADLVFHCAATVDWGRVSDRELEAVNVGGTETVLEACRREGVGAVVHTSSIDAVYGGDPVIDGDETLPYPIRYPSTYGRTKAESERRALDANDGALRTTVVRPCCIFGEADPWHARPLLEMAERGRLIRIGDGRARSQWSYVGNVAHLHRLAGASLLAPEAKAAGERYFVTDVEPANFFAFLAPFLEAAGHRMPRWSLPRAPLYALGATFEGAARLVPEPFRPKPTLTRFAVDFVTQDFTIRTDKAALELGYRPLYPPDEALARTTAWYAGLRG
ncbi:MAG TPA: NAD-dependent epimerase/dehydratase family protein [Sandaracinaceae bacterium LLY-WYZ-13_1]|nr:NAD-dependent epimerase/dehydratase family protein [Sandaracinaceae bacterium LLY-WYZ-13_1]